MYNSKSWREIRNTSGGFFTCRRDHAATAKWADLPRLEVVPLRRFIDAVAEKVDAPERREIRKSSRLEVPTARCRSSPAYYICKGGGDMSDLFKAGKAKRTTGGFTVSTAGGSDIVKRLQKLETGGKVAIERTVSDFTSRAPAWVSKGIREHYGVDTAAIKDAEKKPKRGATSLKVAGIQVDGATLEYEGRLLTPTHFKMAPKQRPTAQQNKLNRVPGQAIKGGPEVAMIKPPKKYRVKATIIKGQRKALSSNTFLGRASKSEDAKTIPWQRVGDGRLPVRVIKSISVPQMAGGRGEDGKEHVSLASESIRKELDQGLTKRFEHHMNRVMK